MVEHLGGVEEGKRTLNASGARYSLGGRDGPNFGAARCMMSEPLTFNRTLVCRCKAVNLTLVQKLYMLL